MKAALIRIVLASAVMVAAAGAGYGAPSSGSQTVTVAAGERIDIAVPASASIGTTLPGFCGTATTTVNVKSNRPWNLQIRSGSANPNGKAKDGSGTELVNPLQYKGGDVLVFTNITSTPANLFSANQPKTGNRDVAVEYQQCIDWLDSPGTYTIVVEYLGVQP